MGAVEALPKRSRCIRNGKHSWCCGIICGALHGQKTLDTPTKGGQLTRFGTMMRIWVGRRKNTVTRKLIMYISI